MAIRAITSCWAEKRFEFIGDALQRIWGTCPDILAGKQSPLDILLGGNILEQIYDLGHSLCSWTHPLQLFGHTYPSSRILEIGAGTGSGTKKALADLQTSDGVCLYSKYVFSDISPAFTAAAQEKLASYRNIEFRTLDITRDPKEQGFEPHSFDLVIASNSLHATPNIREALFNVRELLSPGGKLILLELYPESLAIDYVMGVLPGWWVGDSDERHDKPYISPERWDCELRAAGFSGKEAFSWDINPPFQWNFTMITSVLPLPSRRNNILLLGTETPTLWARTVASHFEDNGHNVKWGTLTSEPPADHDIMVLLDVEEPFLYNLQHESFLSLQEYIRKVQTRIIWVNPSTQLSCSDPRYGLIFGFARTLRHEMLLDISIFETSTFDQLAVTSLYKVYRKIDRTRDDGDLDPEYEFALHGGTVHVGRCHWGTCEGLQLSQTNKRAKKLDIGTYGLLDTLHWVDVQEQELAECEVEVDMQYAALNFRDMMVAMGAVGNKADLGLEGCGVVRRVGAAVTDLFPGNRVVLLGRGLLRTRLVAARERCHQLPDNISPLDGAAMLAVFSTAIYSLMDLALVKKGQSVLIHSACGGVGLAAVQICRMLDAEIFVTVGSKDKVQYLIDDFGIPGNRIFNSRSSAFLKDVLRETEGRGVDIVLNSLAGELLHASWECVAPGGKMIELGKRDFLTNGTLSLAPFAQNRALFGVDLLQLMEQNIDLARDLFKRVFDLHEQGKIKPIRPVTRFRAVQIVDAFKHMQQGLHKGKILVEMPRSPADLPEAYAETEHPFSRHVSYLLVGGLGGLGRAVSTWMVENGARHLVYLSRSAGQSDDHQSFLKELEVLGCQVLCVQGSVADLSDVQRAVETCPKPLAGVLQMSLDLKDRTYEKMTYDEWTLGLSCKVQGTWNLHYATQHHQLDFFVLLGSICGLCGTTGQGNYAAANTFLSAFTQYRRQLGLPCSALDLGPVKDIGLLNREPRYQEVYPRAAALRMLYESEVIKGIKMSIESCGAEHNTKVSPSIIMGLSNTKPLTDPGVRTFWTKDIRYALYGNMESGVDFNTSSDIERIRALLAEIEQSPAVLDENAEARVHQELGWLITKHMANADKMSEEEIGNTVIDSLMTIEIRRWVRRNLRLEVSLVEINKAGTVRGLSGVIMQHLKAKYGPQKICGK